MCSLCFINVVYCDVSNGGGGSSGNYGRPCGRVTGAGMIFGCVLGSL